MSNNDQRAVLTQTYVDLSITAIAVVVVMILVIVEPQLTAAIIGICAGILTMLLLTIIRVSKAAKAQTR